MPVAPLSDRNVQPAFHRLMRRARYLTVVDFFERRYGKVMGVFGSLVQLAAYFAWTAAQFVAGGHVLHKLLGWPLLVGMLVVGTVVTLYTTMGGMWADTLGMYWRKANRSGAIATFLGGFATCIADALHQYAL